MAEPGHNRRDFLKGRAALRTLADKAQRVVDETVDKLDAAAGPTESHRCVSRRAMACDFELKYHLADDARLLPVAMGAMDLIERLETQLTVYRDWSEIVEINRRAAEGPVPVETRLFGLLRLCGELFTSTGGALDITGGPLSAAWGFDRRQGRVPSDEELTEALSLVGFENVVLDEDAQTIRFLKPGTAINLNAIGKGYALDRAAETMEAAGATDFLWHAGRSSVLARGRNRCGTGDHWTVRLTHPLRPEQTLAEFHLRNRALATSGGATQGFMHEGRRLGHVIDPRTGRPAEGVCTATAIAPTAAEADALSTAFYVMQPREIERFCEEHTDVGAAVVRPVDGGGIQLETFGLSDEEITRYSHERRV